MIWRNPSLVALLLACQHCASAAPTWPASTDDLEDIMLLNSGYRARGFATAVTPCSAAPGPGRLAAAEWIRTAFHDMSTGNVYSGVGGLDASIVFETKSGENAGAAFNTTLTTYAPFLSARTSMADIIAAGVYTAVRSCGGPIVPIRGGHVDATAAGLTGVPQPQNAISIFRNQYQRFGFGTDAEMIQFTACGHTLGGVHASNFPQIVAPGSVTNDYGLMDTTSTVFDNKVVTEYLDGTTTNPLVVGISIKNTRNSDFKVYNADGNATMNMLRDPQTFANVCQKMFQKMVEVVPSGVTLSDTVTPYEIKPYDLQLTLLDGGAKINFTGDIRVRTTTRAASSISQVQLIYKDRTGAAVPTPISTISKGTASGFDDTFTFYGFSAQLPADTSISSFTILIKLASGATETWDNNGFGFKVDDTVIYQAPNSCLDTSGKLTIVAAIRNGASSPNLNVVVKNPRASPIVVPALSTATVAMTTQSAVGSYELYSASYTFSGLQAQSAIFGVSAGTASDNFKNPNSLPGACVPLGSVTPTPTPTVSSSSVASNSPSVPISDSTIVVLSTSTTMLTSVISTLTASSTAPPSATSSSTLTVSSIPSSIFTSSTLNPSSTTPTASTPTPSSNSTVPNFAGYNYTGCLTDSVSDRTFTAKGQGSNNNTYESCATFCSGYMYFGVEYGSECYCGNALPTYANLHPDTECNMPCAGNSGQICGAGDRLTIFQSLTLYPPPSNPTIPGYSYSGCHIDNVHTRILGDSFLYAHNMTVPMCAQFCSGKKYFGVEYGEQCYCGDLLGQSSVVEERQCSMECPGDQGSFCGAGDRIGVWSRN